MSSSDELDNVQDIIKKWISNGNIEKTLDLKRKKLTTLEGLGIPANVKSLDVTDNELSSIPSKFDKLIELLCSKNQLEEIPSTFNKLIYLYCNDNQLKKLPPTFDKLIFLNCNNNQLKKLPPTYVNILQLFCSNNQLKEISSKFDKLTYLNCNYNQLTELPLTFNKLRTILCWKNQLTEIPSEFVKLTELECPENQLTELSSKFVKLTRLVCSDNQLTELPSTLVELTEFFCRNNQLKEIPSTFNKLTYLDCMNNNLTTLPSTFDKLTTLRCEGNPFYSLPEMYRNLVPKLYRELEEAQSQRGIPAQQVAYVENDEEEKEDEDIVYGIPEVESKFLTEKCNNKTDILQDVLKTNDGVTAILFRNEYHYVAYCYPYNELKEMWNSSNDVFEWDRGAVRTKPVYKDPYTGRWFDSNSLKIIEKYNTFVAVELGVKKIGSEFGVSNLHGAEEMLYTLKPINFWRFFRGWYVKDESIKDFVPTPRDYNVNYTGVRD